MQQRPDDLPAELPLEALPTEWATPDYVRSLEDLEGRLDTWPQRCAPVGDVDYIGQHVWAELVLHEPVPLPPPQPARIDLRELVCQVCGDAASPHRKAHDVQVTVPARG